jgi:hypothetical protein
MDIRGFHVKNEAARAILENVGASFVAGYGYAAEAADVPGAERRLETVARRFRGFAYEGAAMGFAVRDALGVRRPRLVGELLNGRGDAHIYMAYIGVGWAMARVPRVRWSRLPVPDPLLRWLVLDGYGFHQAYFHTTRYVHRQHRQQGVQWPVDGPAWYADRVLDQGIGRALWFVGGTDVDHVAALIDGFAEHRKADLYSGAGLAATYAGGATEDELRRFWSDAGEYRVHVAQGSAFAAGARVRADLVVPHNELATQVFCGLNTAEAAKVTDAALPRAGGTRTLPAYETWRMAIADEFRGRC